MGMGGDGWGGAGPADKSRRAQQGLWRLKPPPGCTPTCLCHHSFRAPLQVLEGMNKARADGTTDMADIQPDLSKLKPKLV